MEVFHFSAVGPNARKVGTDRHYLGEAFKHVKYVSPSLTMVGNGEPLATFLSAMIAI